MSIIQQKKDQLAQKMAEAKILQDEIANLILAGNAERAAKFAAAPANEVVHQEPEMRTATDENVARLAKQKRIDWEEAWTELRCKELEDGESICCSEECEGNDSAIDELVWAAEAGKEKRNARRAAAGRAVSEDEGNV